jgi:hypothetical protein
MKKIYYLYLLLLIYIIFIFYYIHPLFLSNDIVAGWDTLTHLTALEKYPSNLIRGDYIFLDNFWFNDYVVFQFYSPLLFLIISFFNIVSFNVLSVFLVFKIFIFILILLFIYSLYLLFLNFFNVKKEMSILFSIFVSFFWIFSNNLLDFLGIGISSFLYLGETTNFLGIIIGIFIINFSNYFYNNSKNTIKDYLIFIFLLSSLLLAHLFSFLFFSSILVIIFLFYALKFKKKVFIKKIISISIVVFSTLFLCLFWFFPFIKNYFYSSAINYSNKFTFDVIFRMFINFNYFFILLIILFLIGLSYLIKIKKYDFVFSFLFFFIFSIGFFSFPFDIHQYRFFSYIYLFYFIFCALGIYYVFLFCKKLFSINVGKYIFIILFLFLLFLNFIMVIKGNNGLKEEYLFTVDKYDIDVDNLIEDIKQNNPRVVYAEQRNYFETLFSSPHYFEYLLSINNINSLLGLYTESTRTSLIYPFLSEFSKNSNWLVSDYSLKSNNSFKDFLDRLKYFNVNLILSNSEKLITNLEKNSSSKLFKNYNLKGVKFSLYIIENNFSEVDYLNDKIILYFSSSDKEWVDFSKMWFESSYTYKYPLVRIKKKSDLNNFNFSDISLIVVSEKDKYKLNSLDYPIIIKKDDFKVFETEFEKYLLTDKFILNRNINDVKFSKNQIVFNVNLDNTIPIIIRKSYSPFWKAENDSGKINIYEVAPNFMLVNTKGNTTLTFKIPIILKISFFLFILFFLSVIYLIIKKGFFK